MRSCPEDDYVVSNGGQQEIYDLSGLTFDVDAEDWLRSIVLQVTGGGDDPLRTGMLWTEWIQTITCHSCFPPVDEDRQLLTHPAILLEDRRMHCGQHARLIVDGLVAVDIPARLVQLNGHVVAEFYSGSHWVLADADILSGGQFVRDAAGNPVGLDEIKQHPEYLEWVDPYAKRSCWVIRGERIRQSKGGIEDQPGKEWMRRLPRETWLRVFESAAVVMDGRQMTTPFVIVKNAHGNGLRNRYYGWNNFAAVERR